MRAAIVTLAFLLAVGFSSAACYEGTPTGTCQTGTEWYCNASNMLVPNSQTCGCNPGYTARQDGTCTLYSHIKLFSFLLREFFPTDDPWKAAHNDFAFIHYSGLNESVASNPHMLINSYTELKAIHPDEQAEIPIYCSTHGCNPEAFYLHYLIDYHSYSAVGGDAVIPGYNASNPGVPPSTALTLSQARATDWWDIAWKLANLTNQDHLNYVTDQAVADMTLLEHRKSGILSDNAKFYPLNDNGINATIEYWQVPRDRNHPLIPVFVAMQHELHQRLEQQLGKEVRFVANANAAYWYYDYPQPSDPWYRADFDTFKDILFELWLTYKNSTANQDNPTFQNSFVKLGTNIYDSIARGQRLYLTAWNHHTPPDDRIKSFFLATFYLINHDNLYFLYYDDVTQNPQNFSQISWIPAVTQDIGQPIANTFSQTPYWTATGPFNFTLGTDPESGKEFVISAREYERALILVKWRPDSASVLAATYTTHALGGSYYLLSADGSITGPMSSIALRNNEGAILLKPGTWECTAWSACMDDEQNRTCTCNGGYCPDAKPAETQACAACSLPNDNPPCDCISAPELTASANDWFSGTLSITEFTTVIRTWLTCAT